MANRFVNDITWTLGATAMLSTDTTLTVVSYAGTSTLTTFPSSGTGANIRLRIGNELLNLTSWSSNVFTVARGVEGTTAAAHAAGVEIDGVLTGTGITDAISALEITGTYSSLPAAGVLGRIYRTTNSPLSYRDNGTTWDAFGPSFALTPPPGSSYWTQVNFPGSTTATVDFSTGCPTIKSPGGTGGENLSILSVAAPATPYSVTAMILPIYAPRSTNRTVGICLRDSVSGKVLGLGYTFSNGYPAISGFFWTNPTTYGGLNIASGLFQVDFTSARFLRMTFSGSLMTLYISPDNVNFVSVGSLTSGTTSGTLVPDSVGFFMNPLSSASPADIGGVLAHWVLG